MEQIPKLAEVAFKLAYLEALASVSFERIAEDDNLVQIYPDVTKNFIKKLPPSTPVRRGQKLERK